jgi:hypothetical protein
VELFSLSNNPIKALLKNKKKSIHPGPLGQLKPLEEALLRYIFEQRRQGIEISTLSIFAGASNLSTKFGKKDFVAWCSMLSTFFACSFACLLNGHTLSQANWPYLRSWALNA